MRVVDPPAELKLGAGIRLRVLLRSFTIQGSWNYRTLVGTGFAFALLPVLRAVYGRRTPELRAAVERQAELFNTHPYLSGIALGAVARLEAEGAAPELIARFKAALRGSLGSMGDRLVWAGWRPACILVAIVLLLAGASWKIAVLAFLVLYNAGHLSLRWWALRTGFEAGRTVAERVRHAGLDRLRERVATGGAFLLGVALPLLVAHGPAHEAVPAWTAVTAGVAACLGLRYGLSVRAPAVLGLTFLVVLGFLLRATQ